MPKRTSTKKSKAATRNGCSNALDVDISEMPHGKYYDAKRESVTYIAQSAEGNTKVLNGYARVTAYGTHVNFTVKTQVKGKSSQDPRG